MHTLNHTAYVITEENFSALSDIIENEWKPLGYTFCEPFTSTALKNIDKYGYISLLSYFSHVRRQMYSHILLKG